MKSIRDFLSTTSEKETDLSKMDSTYYRDYYNAFVRNIRANPEGKQKPSDKKPSQQTTASAYVR